MSSVLPPWVISMIGLFIFIWVIVVAAWLFNPNIFKKDGDPCYGKDEKGTYKMKDGTCELESCAIGWQISGTACTTTAESTTAAADSPTSPPPLEEYPCHHYSEYECPSRCTRTWERGDYLCV